MFFQYPELIFTDFFAGGGRGCGAFYLGLKIYVHDF